MAHRPGKWEVTRVNWVAALLAMGGQERQSQQRFWKLNCGVILLWWLQVNMLMGLLLPIRPRKGCGAVSLPAGTCSPHCSPHFPAFPSQRRGRFPHQRWHRVRIRPGGTTAVLLQWDRHRHQQIVPLLPPSGRSDAACAVPGCALRWDVEQGLGKQTHLALTPQLAAAQNPLSLGSGRISPSLTTFKERFRV